MEGGEGGVSVVCSATGGLGEEIVKGKGGRWKGIWGECNRWHLEFEFAFF